MKTKEEYMNELYIIDGIKKCVLRYANSVSKERNTDEWCKEYIDYLCNRENNIQNKIKRLER